MCWRQHIERNDHPVHSGVPTEPGLQAGDIHHSFMAEPLRTTNLTIARIATATFLVTLLVGCASSSHSAAGNNTVPSAAPAQSPEAGISSAPAAPTRFVFAADPPPATWLVESRTRVIITPANASPISQELETSTRAIVHWKLTRSPSGSLRGTGHVDSLRVDVQPPDRLEERAADNQAKPIGMTLLMAEVDSTGLRVTPRADSNAVDCREPDGGAAMSGVVLMRIPDGIAVGSSWRDSTTTEFCQSGVLMTSRATADNLVEKSTRTDLVLLRTIVAEISGSGGTAFRRFEVGGKSKSTQRVLIDIPSGLVRSVEGSGTMNMETTERRPGVEPIVAGVQQTMTFKAERVVR